MNLFGNIRECYGQSTVKHLRDIENVEKKLQRHRNHLVFSLRCRDLNLTPSSLKLRCPINSKKAKDIIKHAEKCLIKERIRVVSNKIGSLKKQKESREKDLDKLIPAESPLQQQIKRHLESVKETTYNNTKATHTRKLQNLEAKSAERKKILTFKHRFIRCSTEKMGGESFQIQVE